VNYAVALSGGVDSAVAAALLQEAGHTLTGIMMRIWDGPARAAAKHACYGPGEEAEIAAAESVCRALGIPFRVFDLSASFRAEVLEAIKAEYAAGVTPNPCILCNHALKAGLLPRAARNAGIDFDVLATGHYARVGCTDGRYHLRRAADARKDQTYFLYRLSREQLSRMAFPLGDMTKQEVRAAARRFALPVCEEPESQDFYDGELAELIGGWGDPGDIVNAAGAVLGRHDGLRRYTIGQRRGIGVASEAPLYLTGKDAAANRLIVGPREAAAVRRFRVERVVWSGADTLRPGDPLIVKLRSAHDGAEAIIVNAGAEYIEAELAGEADTAVPGQSAVFYRDDAVAAGGIIA